MYWCGEYSIFLHLDYPLHCFIFAFALILLSLVDGEEHDGYGLWLFQYHYNLTKGKKGYSNSIEKDQARFTIAPSSITSFHNRVLVIVGYLLLILVVNMRLWCLLNVMDSWN